MNILKKIWVILGATTKNIREHDANIAIKLSDNEPAEKKEVSPPWATYPGFPPGDFFWREAGQPWFAYVWEPYWKSLTDSEQKAYLEKWSVPDDWEWYFDVELQAWLETIDRE